MMYRKKRMEQDLSNLNIEIADWQLEAAKMPDELSRLRDHLTVAL
jgi:hypothetical protein